MCFEIHLSHCITLFAVICCYFYIFHLRRKIRSFVTVNCWFCNTNVQIAKKNENAWFCEHCQQFNGFKEDGDYSIPLPEQYDEALNRKYTNPLGFPNHYTPASNGLCRICNINQELKIKQLAMYEPFDEKNYDEEIEIFRRKLENLYKLCPCCENNVKNTLSRKARFWSPVNKSPIHKNTEKRTECSPKKSQIKKWICFIFFSTFGISVASFLKMKMPQNCDVSSLFIFFLEKFIRLDSSQWCSLVLNITLTLLIMALIFSYIRYFQRSVAALSGVFVMMISDDLMNNFKFFGIFTLIICHGFKYAYKKRKQHDKLMNVESKLTDTFVSQKTEDIEQINQTSPLPGFNSNLLVFDKMKLCNKFSDMNLGKSYEVASCAVKQSYLFKPNKILIQPPKLRIDHHEYDDTRHASPTVSSGYESVINYLKTTDCVSEFDSVSQVDLKMHRKGLLQSSRYDIFKTSQLTNAEKYYGISPIHSPDSSYDLSVNKSHPYAKVNVPMYQIISCSVLSFVLGFSFQTFIHNVYLK